MRVQTNSSAPVLGLLGVAFVVLKLTGTIGWSWWWVLSPFYVTVGIPVLLLFAAAALYVSGAVGDRIIDTARRPRSRSRGRR